MEGAGVSGGNSWKVLRKQLEWVLVPPSDIFPPLISQEDIVGDDTKKKDGAEESDAGRERDGEEIEDLGQRQRDLSPRSQAKSTGSPLQTPLQSVPC